MKNRILLIGSIVLMIALVLAFSSCPGPNPDPDPDPVLPIPPPAQPPTTPEAAGDDGVYTNGTNLVIKNGTQVYDVSDPYYGSIADTPPYSGSGDTVTISKNHNDVGTVWLPANGKWGTTTIAAPSDDILVSFSDFCDERLDFTPPAGSIKKGADVHVAYFQLYCRQEDPIYLFHSFHIVAPNTIFQGRYPESGEIFRYVYSKGEVIAQLLLTEVEPGWFVEANLHLKAGWNCIAGSVSGNTSTLVSKNPMPGARWVRLDYSTW